MAGSCFTLAIGRYAPAAAAILPGLWAITFGLGIFAALGNCPPLTVLAAAYFLLLWHRGARHGAGWPFPLSLGDGGHVRLVAISSWQPPSYFGLERRHGTN